jgi:hypothetical protein
MGTPGELMRHVIARRIGYVERILGSGPRSYQVSV